MHDIMIKLAGLFVTNAKVRKPKNEVTWNDFFTILECSSH